MSHQTTAPVVLEAPHADKQHMYSFWGRSEAQTMAMNNAVRKVLGAHKLSPFHQVGTKPDGENIPGYHAWEIWRPASEEHLTQILHEIDEAAQEEYTLVRSMYLEKHDPEMYEQKEFGDHVEKLIAEHKEKAHTQRTLGHEPSHDKSDDLGL